jgi:hypothetical protein
MSEDSTAMMGVQRELGRLSEAMENTNVARTEITRRFDIHDGKFDEIRGAIYGLDQTIKSSSVILTQLATEKCGERLDKIERQLDGYDKLKTEHEKSQEDLKFYRRIIGGAWSLLWKVVALVLGSGLAGGLVAKLL